MMYGYKPIMPYKYKLVVLYEYKHIAAKYLKITRQWPDQAYTGNSV